MTEETEHKIKELKKKKSKLKQEVDYYNSLQLALKLCLNGSYGAYASKYFILFSNQVAGTITAEGRELTKTMSKDNEDYWYNKWHKDTELHRKMFIKNVQKIPETKPVSVYGDTDSIFVGFDPSMESCVWQNRVFNERFINKCPNNFVILTQPDKIDKISNLNKKNDKFKGFIEYNKNLDQFIYNNNKINKIDEIDEDLDLVCVDGFLVKEKNVDGLLDGFQKRVIYNWENELEFIHGLDKFRVEKYFKNKLDDHAGKYNVSNVEDFELEKISESIINLEKKKYIQHIRWEEGIYHPPLSYFQPKGVELVRSSTPLFARDKDNGIYKAVKYLFKNPDDFKIQDLIGIIKEMRRQFELADVNDIGGQSSCSKYEEKVIDDKNNLEFVSGAHFAVKASGFHNFLLNKHKNLQTKYEFIKSGDKIKYYYTKNSINNVFAFKRGEYPLEFAPEVDYDLQFYKVILKPINSIIKKLGLPEINQRISVIMDIFSDI